MTKKEGGLQLTSLSANFLSLRINRDPYLEDLVFIRSNSLTIDAYNPAINKLIQLAFLKLKQGAHGVTSFLRAIPPVKIKVLSNLDKTINPVVGSRVYVLRERKEVGDILRDLFKFHCKDTK
ncbi:MAG: hypothetical protein J1E16_12745 [Muribaculaceae bacterium]|nr:hypothetical protein [Muribaculaceae bacterium]